MTGRHAGGSGESRRAGQPRGRRRAAWVLLAAVGLVLLAAGWLGWTGLRARDELDQARQDTARLRTALVAGDTAGATAAQRSAATHAAAAHDLTDGALWRLAGAVPYLGRTPRAVTATAAAVDHLAQDVLPGLVAVGRVLDPATLRHGSQVDVAALAAGAPAVARADSGLARAQAELDAVPLDGVAGPVADAVRKVRAQVAAVRPDLDAAVTATRLLPAMLGAGGTRRYLVVFQNDAEARGTGGLVGAFGVLEATRGRLAVVRLGSDDELRSAAAPVVDLGAAYRQLFGLDPALWPNTNLSAHFPNGAVQQLELWRRQYGQHLDGVVALDPVALGYLLAATGPARLPDGEQVTGADVAALTMKDVYARYAAPSQVPQRKAFLQVVAKAALGAVLSGSGGARAELTALGRAVGERRLLVYSAHPSEEGLLASTALGGVVDATPGPYAALALDNASGSKIDYYVGRRLTYSLGACLPGAPGQRASTVTVALHDGAPASGLPAYVGFRLDRGPGTTPAGLGGDGSVRETVLVYAAVGAQLTGATLDGATTSLTPGQDGAGAGRTVFVASVELAAGQTRTLVLHLREPAVAAVPRGWVAPGVQPGLAIIPTVAPGSCR